jgi:hypothetical protein
MTERVGTSVYVEVEVFVFDPLSGSPVSTGGYQIFMFHRNVDRPIFLANPEFIAFVLTLMDTPKGANRGGGQGRARMLGAVIVGGSSYKLKIS